METKLINTTPAGLRALLAFSREPYRSGPEDQVSFEDLSRLRRLNRLLERADAGSPAEREEAGQ